MTLLDTSGLLAAVVAAAKGPLLLSPFVLAELDYLIATRVGPTAQADLLEEVVRGAYRLETFGAADVALVRDVIARYPELRLGLADASIVVLAARHGTRDVLTLDQRHFRTVRTLDRKRFRLLPTDR